MRQLMQAGRNLRVGLVVCEKPCGGGSRPQGWTDGVVLLQPALAAIGWRSADGGEVRDVAVSLAVEVLYHRVGDLSVIPPDSLDSPRRMPATWKATAARHARASQLPCPALGGGVPPWLSHVCGRVSATLTSPSSPHAHPPTPTGPALRSWGTLLPVLRPRRYPDRTTLLLSSFPPLLVLPPPRSRRQR